MSQTAFVIGPFGRGTRGSVALPYGAEWLGSHGYTVNYADPSISVLERVAPLRWVLRAVHRWSGCPLLDPVLQPAALIGADLVVCFLEDNLTVLAPTLRLLRRGKRRAGTVLIVVWLSDAVDSMNQRSRRRWRHRLTAFGRVLVLSSNQVELLTRALGLPQGLVQFIPFGVAPLQVTAPGRPERVLTVGSDDGRDFATFVAALDGAAVEAMVLTNAAHRSRLGDPGSIYVTGPAPRDTYLGLLADAGVVVSVTRSLAYPGGQTALLEAMQAGKACVVTDTEALADYLRGDEVILVPPSDAAALRAAVERLRDDDGLRSSLGAAAARQASQFTEEAMWAAIARSVRDP